MYVINVASSSSQNAGRRNHPGKCDNKSRSRRNVQGVSLGPRRLAKRNRCRQVGEVQSIVKREAKLCNSERFAPKPCHPFGANFKQQHKRHSQVKQNSTRSPDQTWGRIIKYHSRDLVSRAASHHGKVIGVGACLRHGPVRGRRGVSEMIHGAHTGLGILAGLWGSRRSPPG